MTIGIAPPQPPSGKTGEAELPQAWPFLGASDVLDQLKHDVTISTTINNTARFPLLEPAGGVAGGTAQGNPVSVLDGGYYDNSGLESALELAHWLEQQAPPAQPIMFAVTGDGDANGVREDPNAIKADQIVRCGATPYDPSTPRPAKRLSDWLSPALGLYNVRSGHVDALLRRAADAYCPGAPKRTQSLFHFYLPACGTENVPLNWILSQDMARFIWSAAGGPAAPDTERARCATDKNVLVDENAHEADMLAASLAPAQGAVE